MDVLVTAMLRTTEVTAGIGPIPVEGHSEGRIGLRVARGAPAAEARGESWGLSLARPNERSHPRRASESATA